MFPNVPYVPPDAFLNLSVLCLRESRPTVCVTGAGAGVDNAWEQEKSEARKKLENAAESPASSARFVRRFYVVQDSPPEKRHRRQLDKILTHNLIFGNNQKTQTARAPNNKETIFRLDIRPNQYLSVNL